MGKLHKLDNLEAIEALLKIRDKRGKVVPFKRNAAQAFYWRRRTRRNILLKARQKGLSKVIDADQMIDCVRKTTQAVVISHEKEATKRLFAAVRFYISNMETKPTVSIDSKSEIVFPKRGSTYFIGTAGQKAFGRGDTINRAHLSEAAFYDDLERILAGVEEAAEYGQLDIESTPNGRNHFYDMWQRAKSGKSSYTPIFIPWYIDGEYNEASLTDGEKAGLSEGVRRMFSMDPREFMESLTDEERDAMRRIKDASGAELDVGQMKWRRYKIWDKGRLFQQEYPEDDVSCFLQAGGSVFSKVPLDQTKRVNLDEIDGLPAEEQKRLRSRRLYAGMDCAEGVLAGDAHCLAVIDATDPTAHVSYELHGREPIEVFDEKVHRLVTKRGLNIRLGVEANAIGRAHCQRLTALGTPFEEWETTAANRPSMLTDLDEAYRKGLLIESYPEAEDELLSMVYGEKRTNASNLRADAPKKKHDDRVFARAIAWGMRNRPAPGVSWL